MNKKLSKAPEPIERYRAMLKLQHPRKYVTIEPVMAFFPLVLLIWIHDINPEFVYVGYMNPVSKARKLQIPEPPLTETIKLCKELDKFTEVRLKTMRLSWWEQDKEEERNGSEE